MDSVSSSAESLGGTVVDDLTAADYVVLQHRKQPEVRPSKAMRLPCALWPSCRALWRAPPLTVTPAASHRFLP